jgi:hypothetical protein
MGVKLNARQQAQLAYLQGLTPKFQKIHSTIELMANMQADESVVRSFGRTLDEIKSGAGQMSLNGLAETAGLMSTMARRGGGQQMKIRGLRELFGSLKINYDAAVKAAGSAEAGGGKEEKPTT